MHLLSKSTLLLLILLLIGCEKEFESTRAERAGKAMAKATCLFFDESVDLSNLEKPTSEIMREYGFESTKEIRLYFNTIEGTPEFHEAAVALSTELEKLCGNHLEENELNPVEMTEGIMKATP